MNIAPQHLAASARKSDDRRIYTNCYAIPKQLMEKPKRTFKCKPLRNAMPSSLLGAASACRPGCIRQYIYIRTYIHAHIHARTYTRGDARKRGRPCGHMPSFDIAASVPRPRDVSLSPLCFCLPVSLSPSLHNLAST